MPLPRAALAAVLPVVLTAALLAPVTPAQAEPAAPRQISYQQWGSNPQLKQGSFTGTRAVNGRLRLDRPVGQVRYDDPHGYRSKTYDFGTWVSPWRRPGFAFSELVASWDASTPRDSWVRVEVRARTESGQRSSWDTLANWSQGDRAFHRTSLGPQTDDWGRVVTDTWRSNSSMHFASWQLRVSLFRRAGTPAAPTVDTVGAMTSQLPAVDRVRTSRPGVARGITLDVPRFSQMIHDGDYPQYDAGGEAWCSPTSTSMVLGYYKRLPDPDTYSWVKRPHANRWVDHAARMVYDYEYDGAGNWAFNTAYAANQAGHAFVTRLRSLREAERLVKAGIPVVASVAFGPGELDGAPLGSTNGHLMVIVGFTGNGDVVVNDPAAARNSGVRRTYHRGQFENAWLPTSGGLAYIIRTPDRPLPRNASGNW